jgi:hypothetical protein
VQNAVWGDDPEVQALCEMYNSVAEIWAYDAREGAKTLRTFHECSVSAVASSAAAAAAAAAPVAEQPRVMRLSYYG